MTQSFDLIYGIFLLLAQILALIFAFRIFEKLKPVLPTRVSKFISLKILLILAFAGLITLPLLDMLRILMIPNQEFLLTGDELQPLILVIINSISIMLVYPISIYIFTKTGFAKLAVLQRLEKFDRVIVFLTISGLANLFIRSLILNNFWHSLSTILITEPGFYATYIPSYFFGILVCIIIVLIASLVAIRRG
ncbi:MAG: hypothetical protein EHM41_19455 [Chloroflexi bacterium]|nr:MAG: hypothetical protein EHM41_19455 [Chloroflexota bacterium]